MVVFGRKCFNQEKMVVFRQSDPIRIECLYSGKSGCIRAKVVLFRLKWLYSGKVVVFGQS